MKRSSALGIVLVLAGAHFVHDVFTALLAPILPLLIDKLGISLFQASTLAVLPQIPSFFNPALGAFVDRSRWHRLLVSLAPGVSGTLMCLLGLAPSYGTLAVLLLTAGVSVASLHVTAPVLIHHAARERVGRGMSLFMVAGELARSVGPLVAVQTVSAYGLEGLWRLVPVAIGSSAVLWWRLAALEVPRRDKPPLRLVSVWADMRTVLLAVTGVLVSRAFLAGAVTTFLPTFLYGEGLGLWRANLSLSLVELAGALGALTSGTLSDRIGRRVVLGVAVAASPPLLIAFLHTAGWVQLGVLVLLGLSMLSTAPVLMALVLENAGDNPAAANGTYFMINFAVRALILLIVGRMADALGLRTTFTVCAGIAALGLPVVWLLPSGKRPLREATGEG